KPSRRIEEVEDEVAELFLELAIDDAQLQYPVYYAVGREGKAWRSVPDDLSEHADLTPIFEAIIRDVPAPVVDSTAPLQMLVASLQYDSFLGKYAVGRIARGRVQKNQPVAL